MDDKFLKRYKKSLKKFVRGNNKTLKNKDGAIIFFKMIETYILMEEYDLKEEDIIDKNQ